MTRGRFGGRQTLEYEHHRNGRLDRTVGEEGEVQSLEYREFRDNGHWPDVVHTHPFDNSRWELENSFLRVLPFIILTTGSNWVRKGICRLISSADGLCHSFCGDFEQFPCGLLARREVIFSGISLCRGLTFLDDVSWKRFYGNLRDYVVDMLGGW